MRTKEILLSLLTIVIICFSNIVINAQQYSAIRGVVIDEETGEPIPSVNVFLDGTTLGASTNVNGFYEIEKVPHGSYRIIASMIGYERSDRSILIIDDSTLTIQFELSITTYKLDQVNITTETDFDWFDDMVLFKKNFLGTSSNSNECKITNQEILEFRKTSQSRLEATAAEPLEILNEALGYTVFFELKEFVLSRDDEVSFWGNIRFKELTPKDENQKLRWKRKRQEAYQGSFRHFLISLCRNNIENQGFFAYNVDYPDWNDIRRQNNLTPNISEIIDRITTVERALVFNNYIMITYMNEWEEKEFQNYRNYLGSKIFKELPYQTSWINLPYGIAMFDINGNIVDNYKSIKVFGYWGWQKAADLLPTDYLPEAD